MKMRWIAAAAVFAAPLAPHAQTGGAAGAPGTGPAIPPTSFTALDTNNDGYVSREEMQARFDGADKDRDRKLSREEMREFEFRAGGPGIGGKRDILPPDFSARDGGSAGSAAAAGTSPTPPAGGPGVGGVNNPRSAGSAGRVDPSR